MITVLYMYTVDTRISIQVHYEHLYMCQELIHRDKKKDVNSEKARHICGNGSMFT